MLEITQINNDFGDIENTKGKIESISNDKDLPINLPLHIWNEIINTDDNPFKYKYMVNVRYDECKDIYFVNDLINKIEAE